MLCLLLKRGWGMVALVTTDSNMYDFDLMGTLRYLRASLIPIICSVTVLAATNSDP